MNQPANTDLPFALMLECIRDAILLTDDRGIILFANGPTTELFHYTKKQLIGRSVDTLIAPAHQDTFTKFTEAFHSAAADDRIELTAVDRRGTEFAADICLSRITVGDEQYLSVTIIDLTEARELEEQQLNYIRSAQILTDTQAFTQGILTAIPSQIAVVDEDGTLIAVNKAWEDFARGNDATTLERVATGSNYLHVCRRAAASGDTLAAEALEGMLSVLEGRSSTFEMRYPCHTPDGERWFMLRVTRFESDRPKIVTIHEDITTLVKTKQEIRKSEANFRAIIENTKAHIYSIDRDYRYVTFNSTLKNKVYDLYGQEVRNGDNVFQFLEQYAPEEAIEWKAYYDEAFAGRPVHFNKEFHFDGYDNFTSFWINPIWDNNEVVGLACYALDITEQKLAEAQIRSLNESLEEKVKARTAELEAANKELETFSYSVSHDLQSPLHLLGMFSGLLESKYAGQLDEDALKYISVINDSAQMMGSMIRDLLRFSQIVSEPLAKRTVDMNQKVQKVLHDTHLGNKQGYAEITVHDLRPACCDPSLMRQVWANLISNAIKYSSRKELPVIEIGMEQLGDEQVYYIRDNGTGFDMGNAEKIFNVFKRLHNSKEYEGAGVGLALVHRIIMRHGGRIWAESALGEGATFYFTLPEA